MSLVGIAFIYIGFAVADGRSKVIAVECGVAGLFVVIAAAGITGSAWLLVVGLAGHGLKDWWQHRSHYVANTRWWPPFCAAVDFVVAAIIAIEIAAGLDLKGNGRIPTRVSGPRLRCVRPRRRRRHPPSRATPRRECVAKTGPACRDPVTV